MDTYEQDRFIGAMIAEGFDPSPHDPKDLLEPARRFAQTRAEHYGGGVLVAEFRSGTYVERQGRAHWLEGLTRGEAFRRLAEDRA